MPTDDEFNYKTRGAKKRRGYIKTKVPSGTRVRFTDKKRKKNIGHVISSRGSTSVLVTKYYKDGKEVDVHAPWDFFNEKEVICPGSVSPIRDKFRDRKSPTNFHSKKRKLVKNQTHNLKKIISKGEIFVPIANCRTHNWWDCGRYDYRLK